MLMSDLLLQGPHPILVSPTPGPQTPLPSLHTITYSPLPLFKALVQQGEPPPPPAPLHTSLFYTVLYLLLVIYCTVRLCWDLFFFGIFILFL